MAIELGDWDVERVSREFLSDLRQLVEMRAFVRQACLRAWGPDAALENLDLLELAVTEAATNIALHAYEGAANRPIELVVAVEPEQACVSLYHRGRDFDRAAVPAPEFDGSKESGYGLYLIEQAVDELSYFHDERGRCGIRLVKKRASLRAKGSVMQPTVEKVGDVTVVAVNVEQLDAGNTDEFKRDMAAALKDSAKVVMDMSLVQFVDSRGCGAILSCLKTLSAVGGDLKLCQVAKPVRMVFDLIRLHRICDILPTKEDAVRAFQAKSPAPKA